MANSYVAYTGDGVSNTWTIPFPYLDDTHIHVYINGTEDTTFTFLTASSVAATSVPADGATVLVTRETPFTSLITVIPTSGTLKGTDINDQTLQALYVVGEARDALIGTIGLTTDGLAWDAVSKPIKNVTDPTDNQDAATKGWVDSAYASALATTASNASAAASSASSAATSASNASTSASNASTSETNAAASAAAASTSETNAATSETNAASSASAASASETAAATSETNASASESAAASSASAASTSATNAATSASNAATSETNAAASYDLFDDRFLGAKASDPTLDNDGAALQTGAIYWNTTVNHLKVYTGTVWNDFVADAETAETNAVASAAAASTSETNAATSASNASTSETNAATSASNASTSETNAATSASTATTQAGIATTQATNAANSASAASTSASNAATSETNAAASYDAFDDRYLGAKASDPTLDNDGDPILTGALYWNTTSSIMRIYNGSSWEDAALPVSSGVTLTGTPVDNQIAVWTNATTVEGDANFTWNGTTGLLSITPSSNSTGIEISYGPGSPRLTLTGNAASPSEIFLQQTGGANWGRIRYYNGSAASYASSMMFAVGNTDELNLSNTGLVPFTNDGLALGSTTIGWSDLYLATGGLVRWDNASYVSGSSTWLKLGPQAQEKIFIDINTMRPAANDGIALGDSLRGYSDLFLASGGYVDWANGAAGIITNSGDGLMYFVSDAANTRAGSGFRWQVDGNTKLILNSSSELIPGGNDALKLGSTTNAFSDLFLASGAVINFNAGDVTLTHSANALAFAGATNGYSFDEAITASNTIRSQKSADLAYIDVERTDTHGSAVSTGAIRFYGKDSAAASELYGYINMYATDATATSEDGRFQFYVKQAGANVVPLNITGSAMWSNTNDAVSLGTTSSGFSDLYLASAGRVYFANGAWIQGTATSLAFGPDGTERLYFDSGVFRPAVNDGLPLGNSTYSWSDLFLASGAVINWNAGDITLTHAANELNLTGGYLYINNAGGASTPVLYLANTTDNALLKVAEFRAKRSGIAAANDTGYIAFTVKNSAGSDITMARQYWRASDVTAASEDGYLYWAVMNAGTLTDKMALDNGALYPTTNDGLGLGTASVGFSDLYLASGGIIDWNNNACRITHSGSALTVKAGGVTLNNCQTFTVGNGFTGTVGIEIGDQTGSASTPFIDFHSGATVVDYDARMLIGAGTGSSGGATVTFTSGLLYRGSNRVVEEFLATPVNLTSGSTVDYTSIPSWATEIDIMISTVSESAGGNLVVLIGDSGGLETTGYVSATATQSGTVSTDTTSFWVVNANSAGRHWSGIIRLRRFDSGNTWTASWNIANTTTGLTRMGGGTKTLSANLDRLQFKTTSGTFDLGWINIRYR